MSEINLDNNHTKVKFETINFIISIVFGVIIYILFFFEFGPPYKSEGGGDVAIVMAYLMIFLIGIATGVVAGFFAGKNIMRCIEAACLAVIIGDMIYVAIFFGFSFDYFVINLLFGFIPAIIGGAAGWFIKNQFEPV